jgi:nucleoid DNA-binding protein
MNQTELIQQVADEANLTKTQAQSALRALLKTIMQVVAGWRQSDTGRFWVV